MTGRNKAECRGLFQQHLGQYNCTQRDKKMGQKGAVMQIKKEMKKFVMGYHVIIDRIVWKKLAGKPVNINFIQV